VECGKESPYDWKQMRVLSDTEARRAATAGNIALDLREAIKEAE
jgi:hypothetical protein